MSFWKEVDSLIEKGKTSKQIKVVVNDLIEIRNKMEEIKLTLSNSEKNFQEEAEKAKLVQNNLQKEVEKVNLLQLNISEKVSAITQKEEQIKQIQQQLTEKESIVSNLQADLENVKNDIGKRDLEIKSAFTTVSKAEEMLGQRDKQILQYTTEINQKNLEVEELKRKLSEGQVDSSSLGEKDQEIARMREQIVNSSSNTQSLEVKVPELHLKIQTLQSKIQELESTAVSRADFDSIFTQNKELEGRISTFNLKIGSLSNENEQLKREIADKIKKINSLTEPHSVMAPALGKPNAPSTFKSASTDDTYGTSRIVCPHCGSSKLTVIEDKSRIISYIPSPVYAKKNICSQCGFEF